MYIETWIVIALSAVFSGIAAFFLSAITTPQDIGNIAPAYRTLFHVSATLATAFAAWLAWALLA